MLNWKGFGRKRQWFYSRHLPREAEEHHGNYVRKAGVMVEIRTECEPIVSPLSITGLLV
jgi:hypothetical protein